MSKREELQRLKNQRNRIRALEQHRENLFGYLMTPEARKMNNAKDRIMIDYYDKQISRLEPLAQKELETEITRNVLQNIGKGISIDSKMISKEIQKDLNELKI